MTDIAQVINVLAHITSTIYSNIIGTQPEDDKWMHENTGLFVHLTGSLAAMPQNYINV